MCSYTRVGGTMPDLGHLKSLTRVLLFGTNVWGTAMELQRILPNADVHRLLPGVHRAD